MIKYSWLRIILLLACSIHLLGGAQSSAEDQLTIIKSPALKERLCGSNIDQNNIYRLYYEEGALYLEAQCLDGQAHGYSKQYYDNGQLWINSHYVHGKSDGPATHYFANGGLWKEQVYKNGQQDGLQKEYDHSGNLVREENYLNGQLDGLSQHYDRDGNIEGKELYKNGRKITSETFAPANVISSQRHASLLNGDPETSRGVSQKLSTSSQRRPVDMTGQSAVRGNQPAVSDTIEEEKW